MITVVPCCGAKLAHAAPAQDLYQSVLFKLMRAYAEAVGGRWCILSAHYGLVMPDDVITPYNLTLANMPAATRRAWAAKTRLAFVRRYPGEFARSLCGKYYEAALVGLVVEAPLRGMKFGHQQQWLKNRLGDLSCMH